MAKSPTWSRRAAAAALIIFCALAALFDLPAKPLSADGRWPAARPSARALSSEPEAEGANVYPWASRLVTPLANAPEPVRGETALFWHVPKSGGTTVKNLYMCMGKAVVIESRKDQILRGKSMRVVQSGKVDLVVSTRPVLAIEQLFDPSHRARVLAVFRHPVDRLISKFFYLQIAGWERTYRPEWKGMDVLVWAREHNGDKNNMVRALAGKVQSQRATETDLRRAKETVRERFVVGLTEQMEESVLRFNVVMGINDNTTQSCGRCMSSYFGRNTRKANANSHPEVQQESPAWRLLAEQNSYDLQLYEYILELFEEQRAWIDSYASSLVAASAPE